MTNNLPTFYGLGETGNVRRNLSIRNMPDSTLLNTNTVMINGFEQIVGINSNLSLARGGTSDKVVGMPSKSKYMMYCIAGHKLYSSRLPTYESKGEAHRHSSMKEVESDELRLNQTYFSDRKGSKLTRQKLQVTSSVLLPLRRLMLIGTDEGLVRVVS